MKNYFKNNFSKKKIKKIGKNVYYYDFANLFWKNWLFYVCFSFCWVLFLWNHQFHEDIVLIRLLKQSMIMPYTDASFLLASNAVLILFKGSPDYITWIGSDLNLTIIYRNAKLLDARELWTRYTAITVLCKCPSCYHILVTNSRWWYFTLMYVCKI